MEDKPAATAVNLEVIKVFKPEGHRPLPPLCMVRNRKLSYRRILWIKMIFSRFKPQNGIPDSLQLQQCLPYSFGQINAVSRLKPQFCPINNSHKHCPFYFSCQEECPFLGILHTMFY